MQGNSGQERGFRVGMAGWVALLLLGSQAGVSAQVRVTAAFVPRKEAKEKIAPDQKRLSDIARMVALADSSAGIARVVFEVDDQFRLEVKQPPYQYDWDTLAEQDGEHTVAVTAYNINGQTGVKRFKVRVENRLDLGIPFYVKQGMEAFHKGDEKSLEKSARKAFKINPADADAIRLMALHLGLNGDTGGALGLLDNPQNAIPMNDLFTQEVRGHVILVRGIRAPNLPAMLPDLQEGLNRMRRRAEMALDEVKKTYPVETSDPAAQIARGDALFNYGKFHAALEAYERAAELATDRAVKRRARLRAGVALIRLGRFKEAEQTAARLISGGDGVGTCSALLGAALFQRREYQKAREAVLAGAKEKNLAALAVSALADIVLGLKSDAARESKEALEIAEVSETEYVRQAVLADAGDLEGARRAFVSGYLKLPLFLPPLIGRAYEVMAFEKNEDRFVQALNLVRFVRLLEPDNKEALAAELVALLHLKRYNAAGPVLAQLSGLDPLAPDVHLLRAALLSRTPGQEKGVKDNLTAARTLDPVNYKDMLVPAMDAFVARMTRLRRVIPLTPYLLDLADEPPLPRDADSREIAALP